MSAPISGGQLPLTPPFNPQALPPINGPQTSLDPTAPQQQTPTTPPPINGPQPPLNQDPTAGLQQQGPITPPATPGPNFGGTIKNGPTEDKFEPSKKA
jgi:hypothetical protein